MDHRDVQKLYEEIRSLAKKIDMANEQVTLLRIEMAEHRVKIADDRRGRATMFGIIGGAIASGVVALVDFIFKK